MHKLTFWKKIGLSFIVLVAILILINHQLNKDTNTPNRLTLSNLFTVDVKKSHVPWITTADNNKQKALDVVNQKRKKAEVIILLIMRLFIIQTSYLLLN